jgi:hypothetical protein
MTNMEFLSFLFGFVVGWAATLGIIMVAIILPSCIADIIDLYHWIRRKLHAKQT